eukprot:1854717-Alexandrium_andersonii.AAC.1
MPRAPQEIAPTPHAQCRGSAKASAVNAQHRQARSLARTTRGGAGRPRVQKWLHCHDLCRTPALRHRPRGLG